MKRYNILPLVTLFLLIIAFSAQAQPQNQALKVEFYLPHYYNRTFRAQSNAQVIVSGGYKGYGSTYGALYITNTGKETLHGIIVEVHTPTQDGFKILSAPRNSKVSSDRSYFTYTIKSLAPGQTYRLYFKVSTPNTYVQKFIEFKVIIKDSNGNILYSSIERRPFIPPPFAIYAAILIVSLAVIGGMFYLIKIGKLYGKSFKTKDIIYTVIFSILLVIWVQIIGRSLGFFALTNRIPIPFVNYALGDVGFVTFFVLGVLLIRKPGVATLMLLIYDWISELFWYGLNPLWWLYPIAEGVPVDLYLAAANKVLEKRQKGATYIKIGGIFGIIDTAIISALRPIFAWLSLYYVFFPYLNHFYTTTYVVAMHTTATTVFDIIYGVLIAYPIYKILEKIII